MAMPASQNKIITKLRERRQIEADLREMLTATSELALRRQAQRIAMLGSQVIPVIVGNLDRADARLLAAMGTVATFLDREEITEALRHAVLQSRQTDRGRIGAMTILERFLGQPPDADLLASLTDPEDAAISSLEEVLDQAARNPAILIEYAQGLDQQEPDMVLAMVGALRDLGASSEDLGPRQRVVEPLRLMAQDVRAEIATEALQALGTIRLPEASMALQVLVPVVAPELRSLAERSLRRLQFAGVQAEPLSPANPNWRALVSAVDGRGYQSVWFIQETPGTAQVQFLNVRLNDRAGAVEAVGHAQVSPLMLPPRRPLGHLHDIVLPDGSGAMLMLEGTFDLGRRLVLDALERNRETQIPVAGPLRLLSPWLWGYSGVDDLPSRLLPELSTADASLSAMSDQLLAHPAFATWTVRSEATLMAAEEILQHPGWDLEVWVKRLSGELFTTPTVSEILSHRLVIMSEWLLLAGEEMWSKVALAAARGGLGETPQDHPFVRALVRRDLELILNGLR